MKKFQQQAILLVLLAVAIVVAGFSIFQYQKSQAEIKKLKQSPQQVSQEQLKTTLDKVGKLIALPSETPTLATVTDVSKLKDQPFFKNAKNGDKVIIYTQAKKAILYRDSENKIIDVAPVNIGTSSAAQAQAIIAIANGTTVSGAAAKIESQITAAYPDVQIASKSDAKGTYDKTIVVALNSAADSAAANVAKTLGATVGSLPSGETKPTGVDILVLIGKDIAGK